MGLTREERAKRKADAKVHAEKLKKIYEENKQIVLIGKCPECGEVLKRNLSLAGWYQCAQLGAEGFRKDSSKPSCSFQCFVC